MLYQTDFPGGSIEQTEGCFVFQLLKTTYNGLEQLGETPKEFSKDEFSEVLKHSSDRGYIGKEDDKNSYGMFVWDPQELVNEYLSFMLFPHVRCRYVAADFMKFRSEESWGSPTRDSQIVLQVRTNNGGGHFRGLDHDPYQPSPGIARIKSAGYFKFFREE